MSFAESEIRAAIATYLKDPSTLDLTSELASLARSLDALPIYADLGGALLIRPNGEVLEVHSNQSWTSEVPECRVVSDPEWIAHAYDKCMLRYPQLRNTIKSIRENSRSDI